jgi:hypothetical protein
VSGLRVHVVRAMVGDGPDRARVDYLGADGRWSCDRCASVRRCAHMAALARHVTAGAPVVDTDARGDAAALLEAALTDALAGVAPDLAAGLDPMAVTIACVPLVDLGWTPGMLRAWVEHARWDGCRPGAVPLRLRELGLPPERPRSVEPSPQGVCPTHGVPAPQGACEVCAEESRAVDVDARAGEVRAAFGEARRRADTAPGGLPLGGGGRP